MVDMIRMTLVRVMTDFPTSQEELLQGDVSYKCVRLSNLIFRNMATWPVLGVWKKGKVNSSVV